MTTLQLSCLLMTQILIPISTKIILIRTQSEKLHNIASRKLFIKISSFLFNIKIENKKIQINECFHIFCIIHKKQIYRVAWRHSRARFTSVCENKKSSDPYTFDFSKTYLYSNSITVTPVSLSKAACTIFCQMKSVSMVSKRLCWYVSVEKRQYIFFWNCASFFK